jgi:glycogen phosphorylase
MISTRRQCESMRVELYADAVNGDGPTRYEMSVVRQLARSVGGHVYGASVSAARPSTDYTA